MSATFCASETSRGVPIRTSASGLNREPLAISTGENLKQRWPALCAEAGSFRPVLALDVVDHRRFRPGEQGRDYQADALAASGGRECENVLRTVMAEVVEPVPVRVAPTTDIDALLCIKQAG